MKFSLFFAIFSLVLPVTYGLTSSRQLLATGHVDEALHSLEQDVQRSPQNPESYNLLCRAYFTRDEWDHAISNCERARSLDPQNSMYSLWLGRALGEKADRAGFISAAGLVRKVRASFERAVELDPKNWEARTDLAEFYLEAPAIVGGGKDKARQQADALMSLNPAMGHWILGRVAEREKNPGDAEREYRAEITTSHGGARGWLDLAIFFHHEDRLDEMEQAVLKLESSRVDRPESLMDGASLLLHAGRNYSLAIRLLRRYLSDGPVEEGPAFKAQVLLGELLEKQGDWRGAATEYRNALALCHDYPRAAEGLRRVER
ncbi:MAG: tetratricopeptide repeat protein [Candidatus Sulfotelmatobacter sp.]